MSYLTNSSTLLTVLILIVCGVFLMGCKEAGKVCLFSSMSGTITLDGEPVVNARLVRTIDFGGASTDETSTDSKGNFSFPAAMKRTITKHLPQEFVSGQIIKVMYQDQEYEMWWGIKRAPEENSESRGEPLVVTCELNSDKETIYVNNSPFKTLCKWDVEPDKRRKAF